MKLFIALFALVAVVASQSTYTTKYDGIDLDEILGSTRLFDNYYNCLLETGRCTPDGSELKRNLPDALLTECAKCSEKQKAGTDKVIRFLIDNKPEQWTRLQQKYDPQNVYYNKYKSVASSRGITI